MSNKTLAGPLAAKISLTQMNFVTIERPILGQMGKVSGTSGDRGSM